MKSSAVKSTSSTLAFSFGGDVVAQPPGVHADLQVLERVDAGAAALAHLLAADGNEAVHIHAIRHLVAGELEHRRPEEDVEVTMSLPMK